jgi:hypothetical protein
MLREISSLLRKASSEDKTQVKFSELSTHDTGVGPLVCALDAVDEEFRWPDFASNVTFELHRKRDSAGAKKPTSASEHYVRILYNLEPVVLPYCAKDHYGGDPTLCKLDAFFQHCEKLIPKDYLADCSKPVVG